MRYSEYKWKEEQEKIERYLEDLRKEAIRRKAIELSLDWERRKFLKW